MCKVRNTALPHKDTYEFVQRLCDAILPGDEERSNFLSMFKENRKPDLRLDFNTSPLDQFRDNYLLSELLSKYNAFMSTSNPTDVAYDDFLKQESQNRKTNQRLRADDPSREINLILEEASNLVRSVVGRDITSKIPYILGSGYFGPGAAIGYSVTRCDLNAKVRGKPTCTPDLAPYALQIINSNATWSTAQYQRVVTACRANPEYSVQTDRVGNVDPEGRTSLLTVDIEECFAKIATVPKNASTDRVISVEPLVNSYLQGGVGRFLRQRLLRIGIDLRDQGINANYASVGVSHRYATVDLKQASNSLTVALVHRMTSKVKGLYELLNLVRSKAYTHNGHTAVFELFSGMGNGATFPLQTLIYWALCRAVLKQYRIVGDVSVYGDDIIFPQGVLSRLIDVFAHCGLSINVKKTHADSQFRESCGSHFYMGRPVKPFYIRKPISSHADWITIHNCLWRWASQDGMYFDHRVVPVLKWIRAKSPGHDVHPDLGDVGFYPLRSRGHVDRIYVHKVYVAKRITRRLGGIVGALIASDRALNKHRENSLDAASLLRKKLEARSEDPSTYSPRLISENEYVLKRLRYCGYTFPFVYTS